MPWLRLKLGSGHYLTAHAASAYNLQTGIDSWTRQDTTSWQFPATLSKRILSTGPDMDHQCDSACATKHMICWLRKARKHTSGGYKTILETWNDDDKYRKSFSDIGWTEEQIIQYDAIALEDHSYVATWQERSRNRKSSNHFVECRRYSRAIESAQWLYRSEAKMQKTVWRTYRNHWRWKQTNATPAQQGQATAWSTIWRPGRIRLPAWTVHQDGDSILLQDDAFIFVITTGNKAVIGSQLRSSDSW